MLRCLYRVHSESEIVTQNRQKEVLKMQEVKTNLDSRYTPKEGEKLHLLTLDNLDGRTAAVKYVRELESQITVDLGGDLTAAQRALLQRAVVYCAILADQEARWISGEPLPFKRVLLSYKRIKSAAVDTRIGAKAKACKRITCASGGKLT